MSRENVELLERGYAAFAAGDVQGTLALMRPDVEVEVYTERPDMSNRLYRGHEGFLANFSEMTEVFEDFRLDPEEIEDRGERIMVTVRATGRGRTSGAGIEGRLFHVWTVIDGQATRLEVHNDREQALATLHRDSERPP